jgi:hypothetical protein
MSVKKTEPILNNISVHFMPIIINMANKSDRILEFGSSTGHMCFILAKNGYNVSLLDIRKDVIIEAIETFSYFNINSLFYNEDFLVHNKKYEFAFNSGLLQCFLDIDREKFIGHVSEISKKILLFYPFRNEIILPKKHSSINGVDGCAEYPTHSIYKIVSSYFDEVEKGKIENIADYDGHFEWVFGKNK